MMKPVDKKSLESQVAHNLREMIRQGVLLKGQKVREAELCEKMNVSRTPVREALRVLKSEGLIELIPQKGAFVSEPPIETISDMFGVMTMLECEVAKLAAEKMSPETMKKMEALHAKLEKNYAENNIEGYLRINYEFHRFIQTLAGNDVLSELIDSLRDKIMLYRAQQLHHEGRFKESIEEHRIIMQAFKAQNVQKAKNAMKKHLKKQHDALINLYMNGSSKRKNAY